MYGPSLVSNVEFGASKGAGGGNAEILGKLFSAPDALEEGFTSVLAVDALEGNNDPVVVVSIDGCET